MLINISYLERKIFISISDKLIPVNFTDYGKLLLDCYLRNSDEDFLTNYQIDISEINFNNNSNTKNRVWIVDEISFKTFDKGFAKVRIHKFDGCYKFDYEVIKTSEQVYWNIENFEEYWYNDKLSAQLF